MFLMDLLLSASSGSHAQAPKKEKEVLIENNDDESGTKNEDSKEDYVITNTTINLNLLPLCHVKHKYNSNLDTVLLPKIFQTRIKNKKVQSYCKLDKYSNIILKHYKVNIINWPDDSSKLSHLHYLNTWYSSPKWHLRVFVFYIATKRGRTGLAGRKGWWLAVSKRQHLWKIWGTCIRYLSRCQII